MDGQFQVSLLEGKLVRNLGLALQYYCFQVAEPKKIIMKVKGVFFALKGVMKFFISLAVAIM